MIVFIFSKGKSRYSDIMNFVIYNGNEHNNFSQCYFSYINKSFVTMPAVLLTVLAFVGAICCLCTVLTGFVSLFKCLQFIFCKPGCCCVGCTVEEVCDDDEEKVGPPPTPGPPTPPPTSRPVIPDHLKENFTLPDTDRRPCDAPTTNAESAGSSTAGGSNTDLKTVIVTSPGAGSSSDVVRPTPIPTIRITTPTNDGGMESIDGLATGMGNLDIQSSMTDATAGGSAPGNRVITSRGLKKFIKASQKARGYVRRDVDLFGKRIGGGKEGSGDSGEKMGVNGEQVARA